MMEELMHETTDQTGPVLTHVTHGGHTPEAAIAPAVAAVGETTFETAFDYLFRGIVGDPDDHLPVDQPTQVVAGLKALGVAMVEDAAAPGDVQQHLDNMRRKDSLRGAETTAVSVRLGNYSASYFEGSAVLQATGNSTIPPVYTYWGQFID